MYKNAFYLLPFFSTMDLGDIDLLRNNQKALEARELIDQYKASDATNKKLDASLVNPTLTTNDCPCVKATQCKRIFKMFFLWI